MNRTYDPTALNIIANMAGIREPMGNGTHTLDFTEAVADPRNYALADGTGGFILIWLGGGRYELHTMLSPRARGAIAKRRVAEMLRSMFTETDAVEITTRIPGNLKHVALMARLCGFRHCWTMARAHVGPDGEKVSMQCFTLTIDEWIHRAEGLVEEGEAFHAMLRQAADDAGDHTPLHDQDDDVHERVVGAACLMARAGQEIKGMLAYNRWAVMANYEPLYLVNEDPPVLHTGNALVRVTDGGLEVAAWLGRPLEEAA